MYYKINLKTKDQILSHLSKLMECAGKKRFTLLLQIFNSLKNPSPYQIQHNYFKIKSQAFEYNILHDRLQKYGITRRHDAVDYYFHYLSDILSQAKNFNII